MVIIVVVVTVIVIVVVGVFPIVANRDSFPLSTYPMFSYRRTTTESVDTAVLAEADGRIRRLAPSTIAATDEVVLAGATVSDAIASGSSPQLCAEIAARADRDGLSGEVQIVTERFDSIDWYQGDREPLERTVHASCRTAS